jgi:hypothetical protein
MGNVTHRKNHKKKLAARKNKIQQQKNTYNKFMQKQIAAIQEQIRNKQTTNIDLTAPATDDTSVDTPIVPGHQELQDTLQNLEKAADGIK